MIARAWSAAFLGMAVAAMAAAAPLPAPRTQNPVEGRRGAVAHASHRDATSRCATDVDRFVPTLMPRDAETRLAPLPTPLSRDTAGIAVLEDDGTFFYTNSGNQPLLDIAAVARAFQRDHGDDYDQLAVYLSSGIDHWLGSAGALAAAWLVRNDVQGIGLTQYDLSPGLGLGSRLSCVLTMNGLHRYPSDPDAPLAAGDSFTSLDVLAHEFAHRWTAYCLVDSGGVPVSALLGRDRQHWGFFFDSDGSFMEGCDWERVTPDSFRTTSISARFGRLDQYLMGVRASTEVDTLWVINEPSDLQPPGIYIPTSIPAVGVTCDGRATAWTIDDLVRVHGPRVPAATSGPDTVRVAFVLVTRRGVAATPTDLAKVGLLRQRFPGTIADATEGRMAVDASLDPPLSRLVLDHAALRDREDPAASMDVRARLVVEPRWAGFMEDPGSAIMWWRTDTLAAYTPTPLTRISADSVVALVPGRATPGPLEYWLRATTASGEQEVLWPEQGPAAPHRVWLGPDATPPRVLHTPVRAQSRDRMPQTLLARVSDGLGVDSVWAEVRVGAGPVLTTPGIQVGADSFTVAFGGGQPIGTRIAYRFLARDASSAGNVGTAHSGWDTLEVVEDWIEDFENPSGWFTFNVLYSWRTRWALATVDSASDGTTAWHCGTADGSPYDPHLDAALYSPLVPAVPPGTRLRFAHRLDLEAAGSSTAWDGARVEVSIANGPWQIAHPVGGYSHTQVGSGRPFASGSPCWSGSSAWRVEEVDLSTFSPGPLRVRFRMTADEFVGAGGWWVDRVRIDFPGGAVADAPRPDGLMVLRTAWPNPARGSVRTSFALAAASAVSWTLHDLQGRQVATLRSGEMEAGVHDWTSQLPGSLAPGLYFSRLGLPGGAALRSRLAVVR